VGQFWRRYFACSSFETVTHGVGVEPKVEDLGEVARELISVPTATADEQHFGFF
jgi:hypothetical protein